jgi:hypothetical protein
VRRGSGDAYSIVFSAAGAFVRGFDSDAVAEVLALGPLTDDLVHRLNPDVRLTDLTEDLAEINYLECRMNGGQDHTVDRPISCAGSRRKIAHELRLT